MKIINNKARNWDPYKLFCTQRGLIADPRQRRKAKLLCKYKKSKEAESELNQSSSVSTFRKTLPQISSSTEYRDIYMEQNLISRGWKEIFHTHFQYDAKDKIFPL
jgi:hypothetical protein